MKNYENRLKAVERLADSKTAKVVILDYKDGKYFWDGKQVDIDSIKANVIIIDNIPDTPPESLKRGEEDWQENEYQMKK